MIVPSFPVGTTCHMGSLPHHEADEAVRWVLDRQPLLPAAPSLPVAHPLEQMIASGAWGIQGVAVGDDGSLAVEPAVMDADAPLGDLSLDGAPFETLRAFLRAVRHRTEPVKLQITGPVTLGLALRRAGTPDDLAFRVAGAAVRARARALLAVTVAEAPSAQPVVFLDEPGLVGGLVPGFPLAPDSMIDLISGALAEIESRAITGLHCCGLADWRAVLQAGPQVLSLPVGAGIEASAGALSSFIERGGWVAWGAVPTDGPLGASAVRLWRCLSAQWCELVQAGCDPVLLRRQALITPVCGLAHHGLDQADQVLALTEQVAARLQDQVVGVRLSVGA